MAKVKEKRANGTDAVDFDVIAGNEESSPKRIVRFTGRSRATNIRRTAQHHRRQIHDVL